MTRYTSLSTAMGAALLIGCNPSSGTVVMKWPAGANVSGDSVAKAFARVLGERADTLERCSDKRLRLSLVNRPGSFPVVSRTEGNTTIQSGPSTEVERNLVRSVTYASDEILRMLSVDTFVVTLTRTARDGGSQRATYQVTRSDLQRGGDFVAGYSVPVSAISLREEPCGSTLQ